MAAQRPAGACNQDGMHAHDLSNLPTTHLRREFHYLKWAGPQVRRTQQCSLSKSGAAGQLC